MFYSVDGKIVQVGDAFPERKINTLTLQTDSDRFPASSIGSPTSNLLIKSPYPENVTISFNNEIIKTYPFELIDGEYVFELLDPSFSYTLAAGQHIGEYITGTGDRDIILRFENLEKITDFISRNIFLSGIFPIEIKFAKELNNIVVERTRGVDVFPDISGLKKLSGVVLNSVFSPESTSFNVIEPIFFDNPLTGLIFVSTYDLSDPIESNLFQIDRLGNTLTYLELANCNISILPEEINQLPFVNQMRLNGANNKIINGEKLNGLKSLSRLFISIDPNLSELFSIYDLNGLNTIYFTPIFSASQINSIPNKWTGLVGLINLANFNRFISQNNFDLFIDNFYQLCTTNGYLDPLSQTAIDTGYPNQFRDVSWGHSSLTQTGAIQAPAEFVQGVSNGNLPMTQGEKIYVLKENYGHIITTAQP